MKDVFEQNSVRPNDQLLGATPSVPNGHFNLEKAEDEGFKITDQLDEQLKARSEAEGMVHYLLAQSKKPALLIESRWTLPGEQYAFPNEPLYREVAESAGCVAHQQSCADQGGTRHMLFIGRNANVQDADYLECLPSSLPNLS